MGKMTKHENIEPYDKNQKYRKSFGGHLYIYITYTFRRKISAPPLPEGEGQKFSPKGKNQSCKGSFGGHFYIYNLYFWTKKNCFRPSINE